MPDFSLALAVKRVRSDFGALDVPQLDLDNQIRPTLITQTCEVKQLFSPYSQRHQHCQLTANRLVRALAGIVLTLLLGQVCLAQGTPPPANAAQTAPVFKPEELDQILAPIALYPDELLAQVLMASTYPLEIVQAERWARDPANAQLTGDQLSAALEQQPWDPSVKSLVPVPQVLQMMSDKLDWTQQLGDAFLAQQQDVMTSVQRLRKQAQTAGSLNTTQQQVVTTEAQTIVIQQANPQVIYVPMYNPTVVYGTWPYPAYPPYYYPPPPAYYAGSALLSGIAFATGVAIVNNLWGWGNCNWHSNNVNINVNRYNQININNINRGRATALPANGSSWRHDSSHRKGVPYRDPGTRQKYLGPQANQPIGGQNFRGYGAGQGASPAIGTRAPGQATLPAGGGAAIGTQAGGQRTGNLGGQRTGGGGIPAQTRQPPAQNQQFNAFGGMGTSRNQVQTQSNRGQASRGSATKQWKAR